MEQRELKVWPREERGKGAARRLRRRGLIPAILYGRGVSPRPLALNPRELKRALSTGSGSNVLLTLRVDEGAQLNNRLAILKELQTDPILGEYIHADLQQVFMDQPIRTTIPLHFKGEMEGGLMEISLREVEVECLPMNLPDFIEVDVSSLKMGETLHVGDLTPSQGLKVLSSPDLALVTITAPEEEKPVPTAEGGVGEAPGGPGKSGA